jgi:GNAT superfamily N-acetyltransferase
MKRTGISIRSASPIDWPKVMHLALVMHAESRFSKFQLNKEKLQKTIEEQSNNPRVACCLLAENSDGTVVGMLLGYTVDLFFTDVRIAQDRVFFVLPEFRGCSAAVRLLTAFRKWAENRNVQEININMSVAIDMPRFERFMTHMGFTNCGSNFYYRL